MRGYSKAERSCLELMMSLVQRVVRQAGRGMQRLWKLVRFPLLLKAKEGHGMTPYDVEEGTATGSFNLPPQPSSFRIDLPAYMGGPSEKVLL